MNNQVKHNRIEWIDMTKGIAILLVIIGHTVAFDVAGSITRGLIFSFHMPLFFILSCVTYRCSTDSASFKAKLIKSAKHLIIPVLFVWLFNIVYQAFREPSVVFTLDYFKSKFYTLFFASGVNVTYANVTYPAIGIPWFFLALFFGRAIFDWIHMNFTEKQTGIICCIISLIGVLMGYIQWLPLSLDIALAVVVFFYIGYRLKSYDVAKHAVIRLIVFGLLWITTFFITFPDTALWTYLELACRRYSTFPLCYITAFFGTMFFCELGYLLSRIPYLTKPLAYIGKNSMYLLIVHCLDGVFCKYFIIYENQFKQAFARLLANLVVFAVVMVIIEIIRAVRVKKYQ